MLPPLLNLGWFVCNSMGYKYIACPKMFVLPCNNDLYTTLIFGIFFSHYIIHMHLEICFSSSKNILATFVFHNYVLDNNKWGLLNDF